MPMYKKTPNNTAYGICLSKGDKNRDNPMSKETAKADSLWLGFVTPV